MIEKLDDINPREIRPLVLKINEIIDWINNKQNWHDKLTDKCNELIPQIDKMIAKNTKVTEGSS